MSEWADLAPQKFLLSQKFRHLMQEMQKISLKNFLSCLVSEIQLFVFKMAARGPERVTSQVF